MCLIWRALFFLRTTLIMFSLCLSSSNEHLCPPIGKFSCGFIQTGFQHPLWWDRAAMGGWQTVPLAGFPCQPEKMNEIKWKKKYPPSPGEGSPLLPENTWLLPSLLLPFHQLLLHPESEPLSQRANISVNFNCHRSLPAFVSWVCFAFFPCYYFESSCNCVQLSKRCRLLLVFRAAAV